MILEPDKFAEVLATALGQVDQVDPTDLPVLWHVAAQEMDYGMMGGPLGALMKAGGMTMAILSAAAVRLPDGFWAGDQAAAVTQFAANVAWLDPAVTEFFWRPLPLGMAGWFILSADKTVTGVDMSGRTYDGAILEDGSADVTWSEGAGDAKTGGLYDALWLLAVGTAAKGLDPYIGSCQHEGHAELLQHAMPALVDPEPAELADVAGLIRRMRGLDPEPATTPTPTGEAAQD